MPPNSVPANVHSISSMGTTPSTMTDILYCTVDTSRVASDKISAGAIRTNVEKGNAEYNRTDQLALSNSNPRPEELKPS